jgi:hypothetical protein
MKKKNPMKNPEINEIVQNINTQALDQYGRLDGELAYKLIEDGFNRILTENSKPAMDDPEKRKPGRPMGSYTVNKPTENVE